MGEPDYMAGPRQCGDRLASIQGFEIPHHVRNDSQVRGDTYTLVLTDLNRPAGTRPAIPGRHWVSFVTGVCSVTVHLTLGFE